MPYDLRDQPDAVELVILHLGVDLRMVRLGRFETQSRLSDVAGISQSTWSMVENGLAEGVRLEILARIAAAMHLDLTLRPCAHPPDTGHAPPIGRVRRTRDAAIVPGTRRRLVLAPGWDER